MDESQGLGGDDHRLPLRAGSLLLAPSAAGRQVCDATVSRYVLEHYPAFVVLYHLDTLKVARAIQADSGARLVVTQEGTIVNLKQFPVESPLEQFPSAFRLRVARILHLVPSSFRRV